MEETKGLVESSAESSQISPRNAVNIEIEISSQPDENENKTFSDFNENGHNSASHNSERSQQSSQNNENEIFEGFKEENINNVVNENFEGAKEENVDKVVNENFEGAKVENVDKIANENFEGAKEENVDKIANENFEEAKEENVDKVVIDTAAPFESVKEAVSKFGGIVDWKERRKYVQLELEKAQKELPQFKQKSIQAQNSKSETLNELQNTKRQLEDLKLSLEKVQTEEKQAKQDSELAQLRMNELKQGINESESISNKTQLEVAKQRHLNAIQELDLVKRELESLKKEFEVLIKERDLEVKRAERAVSESREIEKNVDELTLELITLNELISSSHATHLEAEEQRINASLAWEKEKSLLEKELKQEGEKLEELNVRLNGKKELELKLEKASELLVSLRAEFFTLMEGKLNKETEESSNTEEIVKELEEVKSNLGKVQDEVNCLRVAAASLKIDLEREKGALDEARERESSKSLSVSSLETELNKVKTELELVQSREKEEREKSNALSNELKEGSDESERAKSAVNIATEELKKVKEEIEQRKAESDTIETKLQAILKEIEATKASEELAKSSINSLQENQEIGITISIEEYNSLSKKAREAEDSANKKVLSAINKLTEAKRSESKTLQTLSETKNLIEERKKSLQLVLQQAELAKQGKLEAEQEMRKWRDRGNGEQRRISTTGENRGLAEIASLEGETGPGLLGAQVISGATRQPLSPRAYVARSDTSKVKGEAKGRGSFFPRFVMFLARKKVQTLKQ